MNGNSSVNLTTVSISCSVGLIVTCEIHYWIYGNVKKNHLVGNSFIYYHKTKIFYELWFFQSILHILIVIEK